KTYQTLEYVSKLNKSLLLLSKIDNHQFVEATDIDLNDILHRYVDDYREVFAYRHIRTEIQETGRLVIKMNDVLATVLVTNLLKNAFVHNKDGGVIEIILSSNTLLIRNTGTGEALDGSRIFERFYQGKKREGSTGLGLSIVQAICRQYGLKIQYTHQEEWHQFEVGC
ncbi:MAG: sensor histidine kinase, partial [Bacteroidaceae bacterium]|nr:sensor histidine kinase [Bacteroidaceae bacterium]